MTRWTVTVTANEGRPTFRICAISDDRQRVIRLDKQTEQDVSDFDPDRAWSHGLLLAGYIRRT